MHAERVLRQNTIGEMHLMKIIAGTAAIHCQPVLWD